jgi:zinc protease
VWTRLIAPFVALAGMVTLPCAAEIAPTGEVTGFTLANGLQIVVVPDHRTPVITHMIWYRVGAAEEPPGKSGLAHFLEHLMFKGTARNPAGRFSKMLATFGGQENAFTSNDYTSFFQRVTPQNLPTVMEFEADRMTGLTLSEENVASERKVVLEEWNMVSGNVPAARLGEQIAAALYLNHPYGKPVIGWHNEIEQLNREDALAFYRRFYTPNNAVLVVAGDVTPDEVRTLAEATYLVPSLTCGKPGEAAALEVLAQILGAGTTGRLYRALVVDQGLASDAGGFYQGLAVDPTRFGVYATPRPGVELTQLEDAVDGVIASMVDKGVAADEVAHAKTRMIADYIYAQDNQAAMARMYGSALTTGRARPDRLRAVTADQVNEAARRFLDKRRSVTGYLVKDASHREDKRS